jgi:hypothetical protein
MRTGHRAVVVQSSRTTRRDGQESRIKVQYRSSIKDRVNLSVDRAIVLSVSVKDGTDDAAHSPPPIKKRISKPAVKLLRSPQNEKRLFPFKSSLLAKTTLCCRRLKDPNALAYHLLLLLTMLDMNLIALMCTLFLAEFEMVRWTIRYRAALKEHWRHALKAFFVSLAVIPVGTCLAGLGPFHSFASPLLASMSWVLCLVTAESVVGFHASVSSAVSSSVASFRQALHRVKMSLIGAMYFALDLLAVSLMALVVLTSFSIPHLLREDPIAFYGLVLNSDAAVEVAVSLNENFFLPLLLVCMVAIRPVTSVLFVAMIALFPSLCSFPSAIIALWACSKVARVLCKMAQSLIALANRAYERATAAALAVEEAADRKLQALVDATSAFTCWLLALLWSAAVSCFWLSLRKLPSVINTALITHFLTSPSLDSFALALAVKLILACITHIIAGQ